MEYVEGIPTIMKKILKISSSIFVNNNFVHINIIIITMYVILISNYTTFNGLF